MERYNGITLSPKLLKQFLRDKDFISKNYSGPDDQSVHPTDILKAHYVVIDFCSSDSESENFSGIGGIGVKDFNLLFSCVGRQYASYDGIAKWKNYNDIIATIVYGIVKNHAFYDANKRTALLTLVSILHREGRILSCDKNEIEDILVYLAANDLHLIEGFDQFVNEEDPDVRFLSEYVRKNSREIDNRIYIITFRELDRRLKNYGFKLDNPDRNYIDVIRMQDNQRVHKAGFPGWSKQVVKGDMKKILESCDLTSAKGIDAQVFFKDEDPSFTLASEYRSQLASLAIR